jgi:transposase InsO family protein
MVQNITNNEEGERIKKILKGEVVDSEINRYQLMRLRKKAENFILIDGVLFLKVENGLHKKVFYPNQTEIMRLEVERLHKEKHYGQNRMYALCKDYFFTVPRTIVRDVVTNCNVCKTSQPLKQKEPFKHVMATFCFEHIMIDLIDLKAYKTTNNGFCWILTTIDVYSKYAKAFPLKTKSSMDVCNALESLFTTFGPPLILQSDNGKEFTNSEIKDLCERYNVRLVHGRVRHPQTQGQVERLNQTITRSLAKNIEANGEDAKEACWIKYIDKVVYDYNIAVHSATNKSPFEIFLKRKGFNTVLSPNYIFEEDSGAINEEAENKEETEIESSQIEEHRKKYLTRMDKKAVHNSIYNFEKGDYVYLKKDFDANQRNKRNKFDSFFYPPSVVLEVLSENRLLIELDGNEKIVLMCNVVKKNQDENP